MVVSAHGSAECQARRGIDLRPGGNAGAHRNRNGWREHRHVDRGGEESSWRLRTPGRVEPPRRMTDRQRLSLNRHPWGAMLGLSQWKPRGLQIALAVTHCFAGLSDIRE